MARINETFELEVNGKTVRVTNDGIKKFEDQSEQSRKDLKEWIGEELDKGETKGWTPYSNFESSVEFELVN